MRILFILDYYYPLIGGAETLNQQLTESLAKDHDVVVLTQQLKGTLQYEEYHGVKIHRVATFHRAVFPYQAFQLAKELAQHADIIQAAPYSAGVLAGKLRPYTKAKIILMVYERLGRRWLKLGFSGMQAFLMEKYLFHFVFDHYVAISESTKEQLTSIGIAEKKITRIYCGIDNEFFTPRERNEKLRKELQISPNQFVVLFAGRPGVTKGVFNLLEAIRKVQSAKCKKQNGGEVRTRIIMRGHAGSDNNEKNLRFVFLLAKEPRAQRVQVERLIAKYQLQKDIVLLDSVARDQLPSYLAMADAIIVPSISEGFGFLAAEVSAMKIPLIVSRVDSLPEVVSGRVIFIDKTSSTAIVQALEAASDNKFVSLAGKTFSWAEMGREYTSLYQALSDSYAYSDYCRSGR